MKRNISHKLLALTLALCMCLSLAAPAGASWWESLLGSSINTAETYAADTDTVSQPFPAGTGGSQYFRIPAIVTLNDGTIVAAADARWNSTEDYGGIDTLVAVSPDNGVNWTNHWGNYFDDNNKKYDAKSCTVMDPALATDGTNVYMLADLFPAGYSAAQQNCLKGNGFDANGHLKLSAGGGSISSTNENQYSYYLGDFDTAVDETQQRAYIYQNNNEEPVAGYSVDRWFNLYKSDVKVSNLFYAGADFQAYPALYLYLVKSVDKGSTWLAPSLINLKADGEEVFFGACPGGGYVTSTGRIIFPCYDTAKVYGTLQASVIYSDDCGKTWTRSAGIGVDGTTSEATVSEVELNGEKLLYLFARGSTNYFVSRDNGTTWGSAVSTGLSYQTGSAMGSITYSKQINGRPAILLAAPTGSEKRTDGKIFVGLVQDNGSINWQYTCSVNTGGYAYSDLTELADGTIGLLYENNSGGIVFEKYDIATLAPNAVIGESADVGGTTTEPVEQKDEATGVSVSAPGLTGVTVERVGSVTALADKDYVAYDITPVGYTGGSATVTVPLSNALRNEARLIASHVKNGVLDESLAVTKNEDGTASFTVNHFSTYAVYAETLDDSAAETTTVDVSLTVGGTHTATINDVNYKDNVDRTALNESIATVDVTGVDAVAETTNYTKATVSNSGLISKDSNTWQDTNYYYTPDDGANYYKLYAKRSSSGISYTYTYGYSVTNSSSDVTQCGGASGYLISSGTPGIDVYTQTTTPGNPASTTITFTGTGEGDTTVTVGNTTYNIKVTARESKASKSLIYGDTFTLDSGYTVESSAGGVITVSDTTVTAGETSGTATVVAVKKNSGGMVTDRITYTITVSEAPAEGTNQLVSAETVSYSTYNSIVAGDVVTGLLLSHSSDSNGTTSFVLKSGSDQTITDVSVSGDAATAALNSNGTVTVTGNNVGTCELTVTFSDKSVTRIPVRVVQGSENSTYALKQVYYFDALYHSGLYYAVGTGNAGVDTDWTELQEGYVFTVALDSGDSSNNSQKSVILLAAKPDDGYAISSVVHSTKYSSGNWTYADGSYNFIGRSDDSTRKFASEFTFNTNGEVSNTSGLNSGTATYYYDYCYTKGGVVNKNDTTDTSYAYSMSNFQTLLNHAVDKDLMVGFLYSVPVGLRLQVISDKLPTMEKTIKTVNGKSYTEGMTIGLGDKITYTLTFTSYHTHKSTFSNAGDPTIEYSNVKYTDELTGDLAKTLTGGLTKSTPRSDGATFESDPEDLPMDDKKTVDVSFTLTMDNFDKVKDNKLENVASVTYDYTAFQSKGSSAAEAKAEAVSCDIITPTYVVDFGLPVEIDLTDVLGTATITKASVGSGSGQTLTFQPMQVLPKDGTYVALTLNSNSKTQYYGVTIIPASNVLYEEGFLTAAEGSGWTKDSSAAPTASQETQRTVDTGKNVFGYDGVYAADGVTGELGVWKATGLNTTTATKALTTSFYGNGFDLIGNCGPTTGRVLMLIVGNSQFYLYDVDTRYEDGSNTTLHQVPLVHAELDAEAEYNVTITAAGLAATTANDGIATAAFDGFAGYDRVLMDFLAENGLSIYDVEYISVSSMADSGAVMAVGVDAADLTVSHQAGDHVEIDSFRVYRSSDNRSYPTNERNVQYVNVLDVVYGDFAGFIEGSTADDGSVTYTKANYEAAGGPQFEIYLPAGEAVTFQTDLTKGTEVQISARAVSGETKLNTTAITSNTEMYYTVEVGEDGVITVSNKGTGLLALANLKVPAAVNFEEPTEATYAVAFAMLAAYAAPVEPEVGFQPEKLVANAMGVNLLSKRLVTLTVTASKDVDKLVVNGKTLIPTNAWMVKMGWSSTYTYVLVDTVKRGETASFEITAYNADGASYTCTHEA